MTKNIKDTAPLLADNFIEVEIDLLVVENNQKLVSANIERFGLYSQYLGLLQDSWFLKTTIAKDTFSITLNDFTTHVFADAIIEKEKLTIDHSKLIFPIRIDFKINELTFNLVAEDGSIQLIKPTTIHEYLYEQIISVDSGNIEIGLVVWKNYKSKVGHYVLILIDAKRITLTELQDNAWRNLFGNAYDNCYRYFKTQLRNGRYLSDQTKCRELLDEYYSQLN